MHTMKETQHIEWKQTWRDEYLRWICGFANAEGGILIIGRDDGGVATGAVNAKRLLEVLPNKIRDTLGIVVDVDLVSEAGKELIEIHVEPHPSPISYQGEYHFRSGGSKQELKGAALQRFLMRKLGRHWDDAPIPRFRTEDCSPDALRLFRTRAKESGRMSAEALKNGDDALLENLHLCEGEFFKRATTLLFSDTPERFVAGAYIKIGYFFSDDDLRYQDEMHGNLFKQAESAIDLLFTKYLKAHISYRGIHRREKFLFPYAAVREALLNAIVHKDYGSGIPIQISVYDDRIVLWNPGHLPQDWTIERLLGKHPSAPYNPLIAGAFFRAGYIESWGRGIEKIRLECGEHGIDPPDYDNSMSGLMVTFRANPALLPVSPIIRDGQGTVEQIQVETLVETRAKTPDRIIEILRTHPSLTLAEVATQIGKSVSTVERASKKLTEEGRLRRVGPRKGGRWDVLN